MVYCPRRIRLVSRPADFDGGGVMAEFSLGRPEAVFNLSPDYYAKRRVLITGAAGSIGSALADKLARLGCAHLALLDHFDHGLLNVVEHVQHVAPSLSISEALCDIRDDQQLDRWMARIQPDIVIHSAALKHVHLGERHPGECILTNLCGVRNAAMSASKAGASQFVLISSDKAAAPVCVMGATKRLAELLLLGFQAETGSSMDVRSVRFGNVLGSQGSVLPRFEAQIAAGGPVEVTHADMRRYFMSANEAVGLILSATAFEADHPPQACTYYMDMGDPVSILDMATTLIQRSGRQVPIRITGLRDGEKLSEQLFDEHETSSLTVLENVLRLAPRDSGAALTFAELRRLEIAARTLEPPIVRQRVFAALDDKLRPRALAAG